MNGTAKAGRCIPAQDGIAAGLVLKVDIGGRHALLGRTRERQEASTRGCREARATAAFELLEMEALINGRQRR